MTEYTRRVCPHCGSEATSARWRMNTNPLIPYRLRLTSKHRLSVSPSGPGCQLLERGRIYTWYSMSEPVHIDWTIKRRKPAKVASR